MTVFKLDGTLTSCKTSENSDKLFQRNSGQTDKQTNVWRVNELTDKCTGGVSQDLHPVD